MRCAKVRRRLPLAVGNDLAPVGMKRVLAHIDRCSHCREEFESLKVSLESSKQWLAQEKVVWEEGEWKRMIGRSVRQYPAPVPSLAPWPFKKGWAYGLMAAAVILLFLLAVQPPFLKNRPGLGKAPFQKSALHQDSAGKPQETVILTLVSRQTGLKINWVFHKDFKWEE